MVWKMSVSTRSAQRTSLCLVVAGAALAMSAIPAFAAEPATVVDGFHGALIGAMKTSTGGCVARRKGLAPEVDRDFDLAFLAQRVLRKRWSSMDDNQRTQFTALFRELVITTYADNFSSFNGERFSAANAQALPDGTQMAKSQLTPAKGSPVEFDYVLRKNGDNWQIVNIITDGVSNLALWSSQYERIFADHGYEGLMKQLAEQVEKAKKNC